LYFNGIVGQTFSVARGNGKGGFGVMKDFPLTEDGNWGQCADLDGLDRAGTKGSVLDIDM
jgi:hypothetical protein